jgi:hypothetical protein
MAEKKKSKWTIMIYMAGDNDLSNRCVDDLLKLQRVGSREGLLDIVVQVDRGGEEAKTKRYHIEPGDIDAPIERDLKFAGQRDNENMGDERVLKAFISDCIDMCEAEHYMLVLWGHGQPLDALPVASRHRRNTSISSAIQQSQLGGGRARHQDPAPFFIICPDVRSGHALTNFELARVLRQVSREKLGGRKFDIVAMDACLMSMLEMGYELRDSVKLTIGSESTVPTVGWPYERILQELNRRAEKEAEPCAENPDKPCAHAKALGRLVVSKFKHFYKEYEAENVQLSACDLTRLDDLGPAIDDLARRMAGLADDPTLENAVVKSHWRAQSYDLDQYYDLFDFCQQLKNFCGEGDLGRACERVMREIDPRTTGDGRAGDAEGFVLASDFMGDGMQFSYGVSIYFPWAEVSDRYRELDFARERGWLDFLDKYIEKTTREPRAANLNAGD